jgi:hypothetical protein
MRGLVQRIKQVEQLKNDQEWRIVALFSFVVVLFCGLLTLILTEGWGNRGIFFLYFLGYTLLPITLYGITRYSGFFTQAGGMTVSGWVALCFNLLFSLNMALFPDKTALLSGISYLLLTYLLLLVLRPVLFKNNTIALDIPKKVGVIFSAAVCAIGLLGFFNTFVEHFLFDRFDGIVAHIPHWGGFPTALVGVFACISAYVLWWRQDKASDVPASWTRWVCFCPLLLFSIQSSFDLDHYDAFVAPAIAVLHGRIPLVDVFSQYGLGYLLFTLAFLVLPNTYAVCASIVSLMNIGTFILYLFMLRQIIKNPSAFCLIGVSSVFGVYFCNGMSMNVLPSTLGFRYLPAIGFVYYLLRGQSLEENRVNLPSNIGFLLLNALWSIECLTFYFLIAGFYRWLMTRSVKAVCLSLIRLLVTLFFGGVVFLGLYYVIYREIPHYFIYLKYPLTYLIGSRGNASFSDHIDPFTSRYLFFLPVFLTSAILFYWNLFEKKKQSVIFNKICLMNFAAIVFLVYIAVHAFVFFLKVELFIPLIPFLGLLWYVKGKSNQVFFKFLSSFFLWLISLIFFSIFVMRVAYYQPLNAGVNDSLIYHLIHFDKNVYKRFWYNIRGFCNILHYSKKEGVNLFYTLNESCKKYDFHDEVKKIIHQYYQNKKSIMLFSLSSVEILFEHNKNNPIIVSPISDETLDETQNQIVDNNIKAIMPHEIVVVDKNIGLDGFDSGVLRKIAKRFDFKKIDETPHLWVFELIKKTGTQSPSFLSNPHYAMHIGANGVVNRGQSLSIQDINIPIYFYNGNVLTIELDFEQPFLIDGVKIWHLLNNRDLLKYRFFSNNAIKTFNVLVSLDGKSWTMVASESDYFMNDKKYYHKDVSPIKAKYVRLNVMIDSPFIAVSLLEVFGKEGS